MLLSQLFLAASAAAYLVVPEVSADNEEAFKALPIDENTYEILPVATGQSVDVPCPSCKGRDTHLQMDFFVEDGARLTMNGFELYPEADPWHGDLVASEVRANGKEKQQTLGYSLAVSPGPTDEEQGLQLVNVELHVIQVGGRFVEDVPTVVVSLVKAATNEILIGKVETKEAEEVECTTVWCEIRNRVQKTKDAMRKGLGCSGSRHQGHGPHAHGHGHHKHGRHGHNWGKLFKNIAINIVLPVLMGLTAGVCVAVVAMTLCSCLALLIRTRRARRSKRGCPFHRKTTIIEVANEEEKTGLMDAEIAPPAYQDEETVKPSV